MKDFLEPNNVCGQHLLRIVSQGNAIIAELNRLSDLVPSVYRLESKKDQLEYGEVIFDFSYFKSSDAFERQIESFEKLLNKDEELRETYGELLNEFYLVFESIHRYSVNLERYLNELDEGVYIQQTIETILVDYDGKQLLCEAIYLIGVILLTLDRNIEGVVRERMLVSSYRYSANRSDSNIDDVCNLVRSTGYSPFVKRPVNYPEDYLKRVKLRPSLVRLVIGRLRSDDVYNLVSCYPTPEHRSVALTNQAGMLFIILYFAPEILHTEFAMMREIVDKFFADNFVISVYMGSIVNLIEQWEPYKAAKIALNNTLEVKHIRICSLRFGDEMVKLNVKLTQLLKQGVLTEENTLSRVNDYLSTARRSNVTLRWIMLHTVPLSGDFIEVSTSMKRCKQFRELIINELKFKSTDLFRLLLNTSEFELRIKESYKHLLTERNFKLNSFRTKILKIINDLIDMFSGSKEFTRLEPNQYIQKWFQDFAGQLEKLEINEDMNEYQSNSISRTIIQLLTALEEIREFHQLESNLQVKQYLNEAHSSLYIMVNIVNLREEVLINLQIISDLSYAWKIIDNCFTKYMQEGIKKDPTLVSKLRATFLKLASALDLPLLRINQASSPDLKLVSQFYSSELVSYVSKVLHIIPETMFSLMGQIINIQTNNLQEMPTRLMKDQLKTYAQLDNRFEIAKLTHAIAVFTEGVLAMNTTLVGVIQIDPKKLLEDGIRRELVKQVASALHEGLVFSAKPKQNEVVYKLTDLLQVMNGFKRSFEYIQDYVCINGLKMWQEELSRIINYNVEQECNAFMRQKVLDYQSLYQSKVIPIPVYMPVDPYALNFIGRLVHEILRITDPKSRTYVYSLTAWYDTRTHQEVVDGKLFSLILKSIGVSGTNGIDRLVSFQIVSELNKVISEVETNFIRNKSVFECFEILEDHLSTETPNGIITAKSQLAYFQPLMDRLAKVLSKLADSVTRIGQLQLIRLSLAYEMSMLSKFQARQFSSALNSFNSSLLVEFAHECQELKTSSNVLATEMLPSVFREESQLLFELTNFLEYNGHTDPLNKVYSNMRLPGHFQLIALLLVSSQMSKFVYVRKVSGLVPSASSLKLGESIDGVPFVIGFITLLKQFHAELVNQFFKLSSQFMNASILASTLQTQTKREIPSESFNMLQFLHHFFLFGSYKRQQVAEYMPDIVLDQLNCLDSQANK